MLDLSAHRQLVARSSGLRFQGRVVQVVGLSIEVEGLRLPLGEICHLYPERATAGASRITAEVVGFRDERLILMPFAETQWAITSLKFFYQQALGATAPYNETHWHSAQFTELLTKAIAETDHTKAQDYWNQVQQIQYQQGGYINWTNADFVDGLSKKVQGLKPSAGGILGNHRFQDAWLSA